MFKKVKFGTLQRANAHECASVYKISFDDRLITSAFSLLIIWFGTWVLVERKSHKRHIYVKWKLLLKLAVCTSAHPGVIFKFQTYSHWTFFFFFGKNIKYQRKVTINWARKEKKCLKHNCVTFFFFYRTRPSFCLAVIIIKSFVYTNTPYYEKKKIK